MISLDHNDHPALVVSLKGPVAVGTTGIRTLKVPGQGQSQGDTFEIQLIIGGLPSRDQHNRLGSIASRRMDNAVCVFSPVGDTG